MKLSSESLNAAFEARHHNTFGGTSFSEEQKAELLLHVIMVTNSLSHLKGFTAAEVIGLANDAMQLEVIKQS